MERIDRLYALLERDDIDEDTKAALRWAISQLEKCNLDNHSTISCKKAVRRYICGL